MLKPDTAARPIPPNIRSVLRFARRYPFRFYKMAIARWEIARYLRTHQTRLLNIGAQSNCPRGWLNIDLFPTFGSVYADATDLRGFSSASFDAVLCEHMIEHIPRERGLALCREIYRILKPGAVVRLVTPDIARIGRLVIAPDAQEARYLELIRAYLRRPAMSAAEAANDLFYNYGHRFIYGRGELEDALRALGFRDITPTTASSCAHPIFNGAQGHTRLLGEELNNLQAFGLEARR